MSRRTRLSTAAAAVALAVAAPLLATAPAQATTAPATVITAGAVDAAKKPAAKARPWPRGKVPTGLSPATLRLVRKHATPRYGSTSYNRWYARMVMKRLYGWEGYQYDALRMLWNKESRWQHWVRSPGGTYVGIPQTTLGTAAALGFSPARYVREPEIQIQAGLKYIKQRYGSPNSAWGHSVGSGWY